MMPLQKQEAEALTYKKPGCEKLRELYRESAKLFLEAGYPLDASKFLGAGGLFEEAANIWAARGRPEKAAPLYERAGEYSKATAMYTEGTNSLQTHEPDEELAQYVETVKDDLDPVQYQQRLPKLCNLLTHQSKLEPSYKELAHQSKLKQSYKEQSYKGDNLMRLGSDLKIEMFYRQRGYTNELLEFFLSRGRLRDAFQYLTSVGEVKRALLLAPFEEMKASIPIIELNQMQQLLLINDLRSAQGSHRPEYADPTHQHAQPGMDQLWDALYKDLMLKTLIMTVDVDQKVDNNDIDGFTDAQRYLDIIVLERMDEIIPRASEIKKLPMGSVNYGLSLLRELYYAKQEVPDTLRQFIGAVRQSNSSSLVLTSTSLINTNGKIYRKISQHQLLKSSKAWFANLVLKSTYSFLDSALKMWVSIRPGNYCVRFAATNRCDSAVLPGQNHRPACTFTHCIVTPEGYSELYNIIHQLTLITSELRFFYINLRDVIDEDILRDFRSKQRKWLELMLMELTYISAIEQDPRGIQDVPVSHESYRCLRNDLERLLVDAHIKEEWDTRNTFSELLELTQRSWKIGVRTARIVSLLIKERIRSARQLNLNPAQQAGLNLFLNRPFTDREHSGNYNLPILMAYFNDITRLPLAQFRAFHAVICEYERIATYLLLLKGGRSAFFILTSWITVYIPEVSMAYCSWQDCISASTQKIRECLLKLVQSLLYLAFHLFRPGNRALFRFGGVRGRPLSTELLLKRYIDLVWICLINIQDGDHELQDFDSQPLVDCKIKLKQILPWLGSGLEINLPSYTTDPAFLKILCHSFRVYADKESITFVVTRSSVSRLAKYSAVITEYSIPVVFFATIDPMRMNYDMFQLPTTPQHRSERVFTSEEVKAAEVICRIWREYKKAKEWRNSPLGLSTIAINNLYKSYRFELRDVREISETLYKVFWEQGPKTHEAIAAAEIQRLETTERYQQFFSSLYGTTYTDENLELVEEYFKEVEYYTGKIAEMKAMFSLEGMREWWSRYPGLGPFAPGALKEDMVAIQREAIGVKHVLIRLGGNRYVNPATS